MCMYTELFLVKVFQEIKAEEKYLFSFFESIFQIVSEKHPVVGDSIVK